MGARLKCNIERSSRGALCGSANGIYLGMRPAKSLMRPLAYDFIIFHEHRAYQRVGVHKALPFPGEVQRSFHEENIYFLHSVLAILSRMPFTNLDESDSP